MSDVSFAELGVSGPVVGALAARNIHAPFRIQTLALPDGLAGLDILARSPTGSGKTIAFAGTVGEGDAVDFTALGDTVNAAARIAGMAGRGELLVSEMTAEAAGLETGGLERRTLELRGREQPVDVWVAAMRQQAAAAA